MDNHKISNLNENIDELSHEYLNEKKSNNILNDKKNEHWPLLLLIIIISAVYTIICFSTAIEDFSSSGMFSGLGGILIIIYGIIICLITAIMYFAIYYILYFLCKRYHKINILSAKIVVATDLIIAAILSIISLFE